MPDHTPPDRSIFMWLAVNVEVNNASQFLSFSKIFVLPRSICESRTEISVCGISKAGEACMTWHVIGRVPAQSRIIIQRWQILAIKIVDSCRPDPFACSSSHREDTVGSWSVRIALQRAPPNGEGMLKGDCPTGKSLYGRSSSDISWNKPNIFASNWQA
jgi:hypothetical protein